MFPVGQATTWHMHVSFQETSNVPTREKTEHGARRCEAFRFGAERWRPRIRLYHNGHNLDARRGPEYLCQIGISHFDPEHTVTASLRTQHSHSSRMSSSPAHMDYGFVSSPTGSPNMSNYSVSSQYLDSTSESSSPSSPHIVRTFCGLISQPWIKRS